MSYKKGKDIKVPFDCLWHYYTRKFESTTKQKLLNAMGDCLPTSGGMDLSLISLNNKKPEEFEK